MQAVNKATENVTLPGVVNFVPGGFDGLKVKIKIGVPAHESVDEAAIKKVSSSAEPELCTDSLTLCLWLLGEIHAQLHAAAADFTMMCRPLYLQSPRMWESR